jgi:hypothetical protein
MRPRSLPASAIVTLSLVVAFTAVGCKRKKVDAVTKDRADKPRAVVVVPPPRDLLADLVIRDPEAFAKRAVDGAGLTKELGPSPFDKLVDSRSSVGEKAALRAIDPHAPAAVLVVGDVSSTFSHFGTPVIHTLVAVRIHDAQAVEPALGVLGAKSEPSKALGQPIYEANDLHFVLLGDVLVGSDSRDALETAGKYAEYRVMSAKLAHEGVGTVMLGSIGAGLNKELSAEWTKSKATMPARSATAAEPLVVAGLAALLEVGDATFDLDVDGDTLVVGHEIRATGKLAKWITGYPAGDANALLSLPKASATVYRFTHDLAPLVYAGSADLLAASPLSAAERADFDKALHVIGASLGHELAVVTRSGATKSSPGSPGFDFEYLVRLELASAAPLKGVMETLRKISEKPIAKALSAKTTTTPYKKLGAEGETMTFSFGGLSWTLLWATRASSLYLDFCWACSPKLTDAVLDASAKATLGDDPVAKAKIATFPSSGVVAASYGDDPGYRVLGGLIPSFTFGSATTPSSGYSAAFSGGLRGKGWMPLASFGEFARVWSLAPPSGATGPTPIK